MRINFFRGHLPDGTARVKSLVPTCRWNDEMGFRSNSKEPFKIFIKTGIGKEMVRQGVEIGRAALLPEVIYTELASLRGNSSSTNSPSHSSSGMYRRTTQRSNVQTKKQVVFDFVPNMTQILPEKTCFHYPLFGFDVFKQ